MARWGKSGKASGRTAKLDSESKQVHNEVTHHSFHRDSTLFIYPIRRGWTKIHTLVPFFLNRNFHDGVAQDVKNGNETKNKNEVSVMHKARRFACDEFN